MTSSTDALVSMWSWPWQAVPLASDMMETLTSAQEVVFARLPTISPAMQNPFAADGVELSRMVTEKLDTFGYSARTIHATGTQVGHAAAANARVLGHLSGGGMMWPQDWLRLIETNLKAAAALMALPGAALAPVDRTVSANARRLGGQP